MKFFLTADLHWVIDGHRVVSIIMNPTAIPAIYAPRFPEAKLSWGFRLLVIPGALAFWPLLLRRWATGVKEPPEECNAHRSSAECGLQNAEYRNTQPASALHSTPHSEIHTPHSL